MGKLTFTDQLGLCYQLLTFPAMSQWAPKRVPSQKQETATNLSRYGILFHNPLNPFPKPTNLPLLDFPPRGFERLN